MGTPHPLHARRSPRPAARPTAAATTAFATVRAEGGLLPPDLLARIAANDPALSGLDPTDYGLAKGDRLNEATSRAWANARAYWAAFRAATSTLGPGDRGTSQTREQWLLPLFRELGHGRLVYHQAAEEIGGRRFAVSHRSGEGDGAEAPPVHTVSCQDPIDKPSRAVEDAAGAGLRVSPHGMVQEYLNASDHLWGVVSNGLRLRLLRDNASLSRAAFVEFDLEAMMEGGAYADFVLLFLLLHRSRLPGSGTPPEGSWLERWRVAAEDQGARALNDLRGGVEGAIRALGQGLLEHLANDALRAKLVAGELPVEGYYRQLLRLVYRLLFLLAAEDRDLLFEEGADARKKEVYRRFYGVGRLRELVERRRHADRHDDLWRSLGLAFAALRDEAGGEPLGLKPLAGGLFGPDSCEDLDGLRLANGRLLEAVRGLSWFTDRADGQRLARRVNYRDMDVEELGSVYESLLDSQPVLTTAGGTPTFTLGASGERKSTGSYYTNPGLVRELIASALEPTIAEALARGRTREEQKANLLALKVCDPACGSGHFLLAAARRIGREVARLDAGETEPDPAANRRGVREAIRHCLYGVDKNPLAVDLCQVALWIEGHDAGGPMAFLDHHIKCGDSLVGVADLEVLSDGIPDAAFERSSTDQKRVASAFRQRNKRERAGQLAFPIELLHNDLVDFAVSIEELSRVPDRSVPMEADKARRYSEIKGGAGNWWKDSTGCHFWTAAFLVDLRNPNMAHLTTSTVRRLLSDPGAADGLLLERHVRSTVIDAYLPFHWPLEFPEVVVDGGFDIVLGNPPWEVIQPEERSFFAQHDETIAEASGAKRKAMIAKLPETNSPLAAKWQSHVNTVEQQSRFVRSSQRFPLTSFGKINLYSAFAELAVSLVKRTGRVGLVLPTGIGTDDTNKHFFRSLVDSGRLATLYDFENRDKLFEDVDSRMKFSLFTVLGAERPAAPFEAAFFLTQPTQLREPDRRFNLDAADIALLNPNTRTCPIFRTARDAEITKRLYQAAPVLLREGTTEANPWGITLRQELFNMTSDSHLFRTRRELEEAGQALGADGRFRGGGDGDGETWLPLYEAKMVHQFDHRFATYDGPPEAERARDLTAAEHADPARLPLPRYWVDEREVERAAGGNGGSHPGWFLGFRDIARNTDERTAIFSLVPWSGVGHTLPLLACRRSATHVAALLANANSLTFDFACRQKIAGTHLTFFIVKQLPVLPPETYTPALLDRIVPRVLELVYTAHDLEPFARDCGYDGPPFGWDEARRATLRAELDGLYAHLYGLDRDDFAFILDQFPIVARKDRAAFGEERTKRLCLAAYDYHAPETLRAIDAEIERVELALRRVVVEALGPGTGAVPPKLLGKVAERVAQSPNGAASAAHLATLGGFLDHCTIFDAFAVATEGANWSRVGPRLGGDRAELKRNLVRFNELRNTLRHSRPVSDATRNEGEAALDWLKRRLALA